eukprot:gene7923-5536_t
MMMMMIVLYLFILWHIYIYMIFWCSLVCLPSLLQGITAALEGPDAVYVWARGIHKRSAGLAMLAGVVVLFYGCGCFTMNGGGMITVLCVSVGEGFGPMSTSSSKVATVVVLDLVSLASGAGQGSGGAEGLITAVEWCTQFVTQQYVYAPFDDVALVTCNALQAPRSERPPEWKKEYLENAAERAISEVQVMGDDLGVVVPGPALLDGLALLKARAQILHEKNGDGKDSNRPPPPPHHAKWSTVPDVSHPSFADPAPPTSTLLAGLYRAVRLLKDKESRKAFAERHIIAAVPDGGSALQSYRELVVPLLKELVEHRIVLTVVGLSEEDREEEGTSPPCGLRPQEAAHNRHELRAVFDTVCREMNRRAGQAQSGVVTSWEEAIAATASSRTRRGMVRPLCKLVWSVGEGCEVATQLYTRAAVLPVPSLKKVVPRTASRRGGTSRETEGGGKRPREPSDPSPRNEEVSGGWDDVVLHQRYYTLTAQQQGEKDEGEIPKDQLLTAYRYGSTWVSCSDADIFAMKLHETSRSLKTLGFVPAHHVQPFIGGGGAKALLPLADDAPGRRAFAALTSAMQQEGLAAVVRLVRLQDHPPRMALLSLPVEAQREDRPSPSSPPRYLVLTTLPFQEDVRLFHFPDFYRPVAHTRQPLTGQKRRHSSSPTASERDDPDALPTTRSFTPDGPHSPKSKGSGTPWGAADYLQRLHNPVWQHFHHVVRHKLQLGAVERVWAALSASLAPLEGEKDDANKRTSTNSPPVDRSTPHTVARAAAHGEEGTRVSSDDDPVMSAFAHLAGMSDAGIRSRVLARLEQTWREGEEHLLHRVVGRLPAAHQHQQPHVLLPFLQQAAPHVERVCRAYPVLALTASQEDEMVSASVAAARRGRLERADDKEDAAPVVPACRPCRGVGGWFAQARRTPQAESPEEFQTGSNAAVARRESNAVETTLSSAAAAPAQEPASASAAASAAAPRVDRVSSIDPAGTFEALIQQLLGGLVRTPLGAVEGDMDVVAELGSVTDKVEEDLCALLMELESVLYALLRFSFPDTHYLKVRNAVLILRRYCTLPPLNHSSRSLCGCVYYNDFIKKLLLWCRQEGRWSWFVHPADAHCAATPQQQLDEWVQASLRLDTTLKETIMPITQAECCTSPLVDRAAALAYLLAGQPMDQGEREVGDELGNDEAVDVDDWIE